MKSERDFGRLNGKLILANHVLEIQAGEIEELTALLAHANDLLYQWLRAHGGDSTDAHINTVEWLKRMDKREEKERGEG